MKSITNSYIKFLLHGLFFLPLLISAQEINWITMDEAARLQKQYPKKIIIDMYTAWCGPCRMLDRNTFSNKSLAEYVNTNFYAVKFNAEGNEIVNFKGKQFSNPNYDPAKSRRRNSQHQLAQYFGVRSYPTILFLGEKGEFLAPIPGYKPPSKLEFFLKLFGEDYYKNLKSQEAFNSFRKSFKPSFSP
jgi:thioredoxin-related protein